MTVPQTLIRIFDEALPCGDHLVLRKQAQGTKTLVTTMTILQNGEGEGAEPPPPPPKKRPKHEAPAPPKSLLLLCPEIIQMVAAFLDPIELQTGLSCVCRATRQACPLSVKLNGVFGYLRILKESADQVQQSLASTRDDDNDDAAKNTRNQDQWQVVYNMLYQGIYELETRVYGPKYQVHPLHLAIMGEFLMQAIAKRKERYDIMDLLQRNQEDIHNKKRPTISLNHFDFFDDYFVFGKHGDYFLEDEGMEWCSDRLIKTKAASSAFPKGPAKNLLQEGLSPWINLFTLEAESHTDQIGIYFPIQSDDNNDHENHGDGDSSGVDDDADENDNNEIHENLVVTTRAGNKHADDGNNDEIPLEIFCLNCQELPSPDMDEEEFVSWYKNELPAYSPNCKSAAQAFCQYIPLRGGSQGDQWDDWTQLQRAGWLRAHGIAPFDASPKGNLFWNQLIQSLSKEDQETLETAPTDEECPNVLAFNRNEHAQPMEAIREAAITYLRWHHAFAKASDYVS